MSALQDVANKLRLSQIVSMKAAQLVLFFGLSAVTAAANHPPPRQLSYDEAGIIQVVLLDARSRWPDGEVPCLSDALESVTSSEETGRSISRSALVHSPFVICRPGADVVRHLDLHEPIIQGNDAIIDVDYVCPTCGEGTDYSLRKTNGSWRIVSRQRTWVS